MKDVYVTYEGKCGYDSDIRESSKIFKVGERYKLIGGYIGSWYTEYLIDGVDGYWNSVLFTVDSDSDVLELLTYE